MKIRVATVLDMEACLELGIKACQWLRPDKEPDRDHCSIQMFHFIKNGVVLVSEVDGVITGIISGMKQQNLWYPDEMNLLELFWFVDEKYRKSSAALRLLNEFVKVGKDNNVNWIVMSKMSHSPINNDVYLKRGFKLLEQAFVMEV